MQFILKSMSHGNTVLPTLCILYSQIMLKCWLCICAYGEEGGSHGSYWRTQWDHVQRPSAGRRALQGPTLDQPDCIGRKFRQPRRCNSRWRWRIHVFKRVLHVIKWQKTTRICSHHIFFPFLLAGGREGLLPRPPPSLEHHQSQAAVLAAAAAAAAGLPIQVSWSSIRRPLSALMISANWNSCGQNITAHEFVTSYKCQAICW